MSDEKQAVPASIGKVEKVQFNITKESENEGEQGGEGGLNETEQANIAAGLNKDGTSIAAVTEHGKGSTANNELTPEKKAENIAAGLNEDGSEKEKEIDEAAVLAYLKSKGKDLTSLDEIINPTHVLTDEEKARNASAFEKRMVDMYVEEGLKDGKKTTEQLLAEYNAVKYAMSADITELSKAELTKELKALGITDQSQIDIIQKDRYFQLEQAEIDQIVDETEKELAQKKLDYGKAKFENKGKLIKENAVDFFNNLKEAVDQKDHFTKKEKEFSSNVDEYFNKVERKITLQLGKAGDADIPPVEYEVPEEAIVSARETLKNIATRKQLLFNSDGSLNHANIGELILKANMFDSAAKTAYLEGGTRQVTEFEKRFPYRSATALGLGSSSQNSTDKGKVASFGKSQRIKPVVNQ